MAAVQILDDLKQLVSAIETTQQLLRELFTKKLGALIDARPDEILQLVKSEAELSKELTQHLQWRRRILAQARERGLPSGSLHDLANAVANDERSDLLARIARCRSTAAKLRRESWIQWVVAQRAYSQHAELLDLIAHWGQRALTYGRESSQTTPGGLLLDASA